MTDKYKVQYELLNSICKDVVKPNICVLSTPLLSVENQHFNDWRKPRETWYSPLTTQQKGNSDE